MSLTHTLDTRTAIADFVTALIDSGGAGALVFTDGDDNEIATLEFSEIAFDDAFEGIAGSFPISPNLNATGGTVTQAIIYNGLNAEIMRCSVTGPGGGGDIELSSVVVEPGQQVGMESLTYEAPL